MSRHTVTEPGPLLAKLLQAVPGLKRTTAKDRLKQGAVLVNGEVVRKATTALVAGDVIELSRAGVDAARGRSSAVRLLHVDTELVVVDKPSGLLTVKAGSADQPTVLSEVGPQLAGSPRLFPCHRLDRATSGVLLVPRTREVQDHFFEHWSDVEKLYVAVVEGELDEDELMIEVALQEDERSKQVFVSEGPDARLARTEVRVLGRGTQRTLIEARLHTGRKHQIRVHLAQLGHPVLGDERYGTKATAPRLCLHARSLSFTHPSTSERMVFEVEPPALFAKLTRRPGPP